MLSVQETKSIFTLKYWRFFLFIIYIHIWLLLYYILFVYLKSFKELVFVLNSEVAFRITTVSFSIADAKVRTFRIRTNILWYFFHKKFILYYYSLIYKHLFITSFYKIIISEFILHIIIIKLHVNISFETSIHSILQAQSHFQSSLGMIFPYIPYNLSAPLIIPTTVSTKF